jgi:glycerol uptake facilitator-like aquaporin
VSGAHFNPVVTAVDAVLHGLPRGDALAYVAAQVSGGAFGAVLANLMFDERAVEWSTRARSGSHLWLAEIVATFGLLLVIFGVVRSGRTTATPFAVGAYIGAAYFFTSSTSFANPAVTIARTLSNTFAGIRPASAPAFVVSQTIGAALALGAIRFLYPGVAAVADEVVVPHDDGSAPVTEGHA